MRHRAGSRHVAIVLAVICALGTGPLVTRAHADTPAAPATARRVVEVLVAGGAADGAGLDDTVRELLGRLSLVTEGQHVGRIDPDDPAFRSTARPSLLARVGIDLRNDDVAEITIVDGRTGEVTVRRTVRRDGPPAVVREEVAHVVQSAVDPMIVVERDRVNAPPPPPASASPSPPVAVAPEPAPPPPEVPADRDALAKTPSSSSGFALDLVTEAGGGTYAPGAGIIARAGGGATLAFRRGLRPAIGLSAHYVVPFETGEPIASAHVNVLSVRLLPAIEIYTSSAVALDLLAGGGIDVLRVEPRSSALPSERLGATVSRVDPLLTAGITGHVAIGSATAISLLIGADVDLASRRWVVESDGERSSTFAPSRVRPLAMLGFTLTALGDSRFTTRGAAR
ncbi:MAG TPA: hypothetical protein VLT33_29050 [Labilithrix sp.]|nr:hypothetical protein [Labilithrix sp.]